MKVSVKAIKVSESEKAKQYIKESTAIIKDLQDELFEIIETIKDRVEDLDLEDTAKFSITADAGINCAVEFIYQLVAYIDTFDSEALASIFFAIQKLLEERIASSKGALND